MSRSHVRRALYRAAWLCALLVCLIPANLAGQASCPITLTGDVNNNGSVTSADVIWMVSYIFRSGPTPVPLEEAGDVNCDTSLNSADIIYLVAYVFRGGPPPCNVCTIWPWENWYSFSFESDMESWDPRRFDIELGPDTIAWSIERTQEQASDGATSVKMYLENYNDQGKIFIERQFAVLPDRDYHVVLYYHFASADWGVANMFRIIAGALPQSPQTAADLAPAMQGNTWNGQDTGPGSYVWLDKFYEFDVTVGPDGHVYIVVGVWGTWETPRAYYVDAIEVMIVEN